MSRTADQLSRIKTLLISDHPEWLNDNNVIITDTHRDIDGMGLVYLTVCFEGGELGPYGDDLLWFNAKVGVGVHHKLNVDQQNKFSAISLKIIDYAEDVLDSLHMRYDSNWIGPIKVASEMRLEVNKEKMWGTAQLKFDVLQVDYTQD